MARQTAIAKLTLLCNPMRNQSIDTSKGFLLLLVIVGHILQGSFTESLPRYLIYGFHMPMFMAISGFLFSANYFKITTHTWIKKTTSRALLPWVLAVIIFTVYLKFVGYYQQSSPQLIIESLTKPFYHLWFIPAWIAYQAAIRWMEKHQFNIRQFLLASCLISTAAAWLQISGQVLIPTQEIPIIGEILYSLRPQFFLFFVLGYVVKNHPNSLPHVLSKTLQHPIHSIIALGIFTTQFFYTNPLINNAELIKTSINVLVFFYLNLSFLAYGIPIIAANKLPKSPLLHWIGNQSLLIYLWHPMAILFARYTISYKPTPEFYFSSITSTITILVIIYFYDRYRNP
jgi:acyltransferase